MTVIDRRLRRYYRRIRGWLPCSGKLKRQITREIRGRIQDFLEREPDADMVRIQAEFGSPETIAAAYVDNTGTVEILRSLRVRRRIFTAVAVAAAVVLACWAVVLIQGIITISTIDDPGTIVVIKGTYSEEERRAAIEEALKLQEGGNENDGD